MGCLCRPQNHILADLVGAAPGQHLAFPIMVGERMQPEGVIIVSPTQNPGNALCLRRVWQRQPVVVIDPGRTALVVNVNVSSGYVQLFDPRPLAHGRRHDVVTAAGNRQPHLSQRVVIQPLQVLAHQTFDVTAKPHGVPAAGEIFAQGPRLHLFKRRVSINPTHHLSHLARFHRLGEQLPFVFQPIEQLLFPEKGMQVNQALDVQAHVVVAMDEAQPNKGTAVFQPHLFFRVLG